MFLGKSSYWQWKLQAAERIHIDALCSRKIKLRCADDNNQTIGRFLKEVYISSVPQSKTHLWTEDDKRKHIKENANINVPAQYKRKYEDLILKHFKIVSIGKNNLGRVKHLFHKIHIKDNEPVYRKQFKILDTHCPFLEESLADLLKLGVVEKSDSLCNSPIFCVPKKG